MSRLRSAPGPAHAALGLLLLAAVAVACDEEGNALPARCADPVLPIFDIQTAGVPADDNAELNKPTNPSVPEPPCVTEVGHGISFFGTAGSTTTSGGTTGSGGKGGSGGTSKGGKAGSPNADAGAGGN